MLLFPILGLRRLWSRPWKANRVSLIFWFESEDLGRIPTGEDNSIFLEKARSMGRICALEKSCWFLYAQNLRGTWTGRRSHTHVGNFRLCIWGSETRGDTLLPVVSPVTHHLLIGVLQVTVAETPVVPSLPCFSPTKETKEVSYVSKGTSTMNLKGKQHR